MDRRGADLLSDVLPFARLWYGEPDAVTYAITMQSLAAAKAAGPDRVISVCSLASTPKRSCLRFCDSLQRIQGGLDAKIAPFS